MTERLTVDRAVLPRGLESCLRRLAPHLDHDAVAIAGGVALEARRAERGVPGGGRAFNDLDLVAASPEAVAPTVTDGFLVSHRHLPHPGYAKFLVQLVEPRSRIRVDIFPGTPEHLARASVPEGSRLPIPVLAVESLLEVKLALLADATAARPVDPKHLVDALLLGRLCDRDVSAPDLSHLRATVYAQEPTARCRRCEASLDSRWPLAPKQQILDLLGYV